MCFFYSCCLFFCILLVLFLKLVSSLISETSLLSREELSSYECGFETHNLSRLPFSFRYYLLTLVFLLFDLEIVLLVFVGASNSTNLYYLSFLFLILVVGVFIVGLFFELYEGALDWVGPSSPVKQS